LFSITKKPPPKPIANAKALREVLVFKLSSLAAKKKSQIGRAAYFTASIIIVDPQIRIIV